MTESEWSLTEPRWLAGPTLPVMTELLADMGGERKFSVPAPYHEAHGDLSRG